MAAVELSVTRLASVTSPGNAKNSPWTARRAGRHGTIHAARCLFSNPLFSELCGCLQDSVYGPLISKERLSTLDGIYAVNSFTEI